MGRRELEMKCPPVSLQSQSPAASGVTCGVDALTKILIGHRGGISVLMLGKYSSRMKVSGELKIVFS